MNEKNKLNIEDMKDVNGGSIWVSEDRAKAISVELKTKMAPLVNSAICGTAVTIISMDRNLISLT